jgi:hypothetical protein
VSGNPVRTVLLVGSLVAGLLVIGAPKSGAADNAYGEITRVFNSHGILLGYVQGARSDGWYVHNGPECSIVWLPRSYDFYIGHTAVAAAVRKSSSRYEVWFTPAYREYLPSDGHRLRGYIARMSSSRWNLLSRGGRLIGYTRGPAGAPAGLAGFVLGSTLRSPHSCL